MHRLTVEAAARVVADHPGATAVIAVPGGDPTLSWQILAVAGTGDVTGDVAGAHVTAPALPKELIARLTSGEVVDDVNPAALGVMAAGRAVVLLLPLVAADRFFAVLAVSASTALADDVCKSLDTLRTQAALALETAALTAELTEQATHDPLTGLANRKLIRDRLEHALDRGRRNGVRVGVLLLDLNGFKQINDERGHEAGDHVLRAVAQRLASCVRTADASSRTGRHRDVTVTAGRLGGDEFVMLVEDLTDETVATRVAERITTALAQPVVVGEHRFRVRASIGIALSGPSAEGPDQLLRIADAAMYESKRAVKRLPVDHGV
jgi:diguanylate cyclase (GGDEF)-like protein